ncbi:uncharacterized protein LOC119076893 isoform X2 [Bradysia coprophila]|uniref:uncharacterized protein LOC119076893 isoform X2 n=1 Tax=Bradysia coprophila TaxID=38358 RepID=UPI00187DA922|nr:uncharacterized protein LOC119076893 isoform X2 [Bradysia coprophila]
MVEKDSAFHIILPFCVETEYDPFLAVLKCAVAREVLKNNDLFCAFKSAMEGEDFFLKNKDLTHCWKTLETETQKKRQMKLLGFWAIANFPTLGDRLFGEAFQSSRREKIFVAGGTYVQAEEIDQLVFSKIKLNVIRLTVHGSTRNKLKHFVEVPDSVGAGRLNELKISRKMDSFDVHNNYLQSCWDALKCGKYVMDSDNEENETVIYPCVTTTMDESETGPIENEREMPLPKRQCRLHRSEQFGIDFVDNTGGGSTIDSRNVSTLDVQLYQGFGSHVQMDVEQGDGDTNGDSLRAIVLKIRDDVENLAKSIQAQESERAHVMVINQKDTELARINESHNELEETNKKLLTNLVNLEKEIDSYKEIIASLKFENDTKTQLNDKIKLELAANTELNGRLKTDVELLLKSLTEAKIEAESHRKATDELALLKAKNDQTAAELLSEKAASFKLNANMKVEAEWLRKKLYEAEKVIQSNEAFKAKSAAIVAELNSEIEYMAKVNSESAVKNVQLAREINFLKQHDKQTNVDAFSRDEEYFRKPRTETTTEMESNRDDPTKFDPTKSEFIGSDRKDDEEEFETDDAFVKECRPKLLKLKFGWMKFSNKKNAKFYAGFVYPPDENGNNRALKIISSGYPDLKPSEYFNFNENLSEFEKRPAEKTALKKFNLKFKFNLN